MPRGKGKGYLSLGSGGAQEASQKWGAFELGSEGRIGEFRQRRNGTLARGHSTGVEVAEPGRLGRTVVCSASWGGDDR